MSIEKAQPNALRATDDDLTVYRFNIVPVPKPRQTKADVWKKRPCVIRYRDYADKLRSQSKQQNFMLCNGLTYIFLLPMPDSWSKGKKNTMRYQLHEQTPDSDNLLKAFLDASLSQDKAIAHIQCVFKIWADKGEIIIIKALDNSIKLIQDNIICRVKLLLVNNV